MVFQSLLDKLKCLGSHDPITVLHNYYSHTKVKVKGFYKKNKKEEYFWRFLIYIVYMEYPLMSDLTKIAEVANKLDEKGLYAEANTIDEALKAFSKGDFLISAIKIGEVNHPEYKNDLNKVATNLFKEALFGFGKKYNADQDFQSLYKKSSEFAKAIEDAESEEQKDIYFRDLYEYVRNVVERYIRQCKSK